MPDNKTLVTRRVSNWICRSVSEKRRHDTTGHNQSRPLPFAQLMGITFTDAEPDKVTATMLVREDLCTLAARSTAAPSWRWPTPLARRATIINLPEALRAPTTIESKTNFIGPAKVGVTVRAVATPVHRGRRTQVCRPDRDLRRQAGCGGDADPDGAVARLGPAASSSVMTRKIGNRHHSRRTEIRPFRSPARR